LGSLRTCEIRRRDALDHLQIAGSQVRQPRGRVGDGHELDPVDVDVALVPVVGEPLADDLALGHSLDELEGPGAHGPRAEPVAELARRFRRDHHAGAVGEGGDQRHERLGQVEPDGEIVDDVDALDLADLALAERARHRQMAFDVEAHRLGVERLAVVELDARAQPDHDRAAARGPLVPGGELRHDLEIGGDVEELVAERGEDQAADVGAADRRVEGVGIVVQADPQHGLG